MEKPKVFNEEKDLPTAPFLIIVATTDKKERPFYVARVHRGSVSGATMMLGEFLDTLVANPAEHIFGLAPESTGNTRLYIQNEKEKGKHKDVDHYREMLPAESKFWKEQLQPLLNKNIFKEQVESYKTANEKAKSLVTALDTMFA